MARIRTIKPGFFQDEHLSALDAETQLLAAGLLCYADDEGYFNANPKLVEAAVFPVRNLKRKVKEMLAELEGLGYIRTGTGPDGRVYGHIVKFLSHQVISHPKQSQISDLQISWKSTGIVTEASIPEVEVEVEKELKRNGNGASAFQLPDWIPTKEWNDWYQWRKKTKLPIGENVQGIHVRKLEELRARGHPPERVLETALERGWKGLFEPKESYGNADKQPDKLPVADEQIRRIRAARGLVVTDSQSR